MGVGRKAKNSFAAAIKTFSEVWPPHTLFDNVLHESAGRFYLRKGDNMKYIRAYEKPQECMVNMSRKLANECRPHAGDPRGVDGIPGSNVNRTRDQILSDCLIASGDRVLQGREEDFICIPRSTYECMLGLLRDDS